MVVLLPLAFNAVAIGDPYGTAEDGLNPAIWGLGARNLLKAGVDSKRGVRVSPYPGTTGNGIYAHHPPLPVWVMAVPVALGGWEGWARLIALGCAAATLLLLDRLLRRHFSADVALGAVAVVACSGFLLDQGRMFNTLTLAAPLFVFLIGSERLRAPAIVLLVLSSWDGMIAAAALILWRRDWKMGLLAAATVAFVAWHLIDATGGTHELLWQLKWRAGGEEFTAGQWLAKQGEFLGYGLGPLTLLSCAAVAFLRRDLGPTLLVAAAPGVGMLLGFRQGAQHHAFWGFLLVVPAAFAAAAVLERFRWVAVGFAAQAAILGWFAVDHLIEARARNEVGALVKQHFANATSVPVVAHYQYHPYVTWNAPNAAPDYTGPFEGDVLFETQRTPLRFAVIPSSRLPPASPSPAP